MSMKCTKTIVEPVEHEICSIGELVTGRDTYNSIPSSTCELHSCNNVYYTRYGNSYSYTLINHKVYKVGNFGE